MDYLKKEVKDLQLDLQDVETTLSINKNIINSLLTVDNNQEQNALLFLKIENDALYQRNRELINQRTGLKDELLLAKQLNEENDDKLEELSIGFEMEVSRLIEQNERKEYNLQFLEQRLVDVERFLRNLGKDDPFIREQLRLIKINPNLDKKTITTVIEENNIMK